MIIWLKNQSTVRYRTFQLRSSCAGPGRSCPASPRSVSRARSEAPGSLDSSTLSEAFLFPLPIFLWKARSGRFDSRKGQLLEMQVYAFVFIEKDNSFCSQSHTCSNSCGEIFACLLQGAVLPVATKYNRFETRIFATERQVLIAAQGDFIAES